MAKMKLLKPELDKIKEKYKHDLQQERIQQAAFCRELGINPLSGCIPALLQMPILVAMFNFSLMPFRCGKPLFGGQMIYQLMIAL